MYRGALRSILSELVRPERLIVLDDLSLSAPKTKELAAKLAEVDASEALIVVEELNDNLILASRNLPHVDVRDTDDIDPVSLVGFDKIVATTGAIKKIEERLN